MIKFTQIWTPVGVEFINLMMQILPLLDMALLTIFNLVLQILICTKQVKLIIALSKFFTV